jgi:hypothetical protein
MLARVARRTSMTGVTPNVSTDLQGHTRYSRLLDGDGQSGSVEPASARRLSRGLGWFSVGLGLCQLIAPKRLARLIGVSERPRTLRLMRALGARELTAGLGLLTRRRSSPWLWARVAGDIVDLGLLANVLRSRNVDRTRVGGALTAVAGVTLLDAWAGRRAGQLDGTNRGA